MKKNDDNKSTVSVLTICFDQEIYNICVSLHGSKVQRSATL